MRRRNRVVGEPLVPLTDRYPLAVTFICAPRKQVDGSTKVVPVGTGFVLNYPIDTTGAYVEYIVTARHVVIGEQETHARFRTKAGGIRDLPVKAEDWVHHPKADVAVAPFQATGDLHLLNVPSCVLAGVAPGGWAPGLGDRVYFVGLLDLEGYKAMGEQNLPMVRSGTLGALYQQKVPIGREGHVSYVDAHLIDCRSYAGFSGSPCFAQRDVQPPLDGTPMGQTRLSENVTLLLGVVSGHFDQWGRARLSGEIADGDAVRVPLNSGVGVVTPAEKITEVLAMEELSEERERMRHEQANRPVEGATLDKAPSSEGSEFERFEDLARKLVKVPKREIDEKRKDDG